MYQIIAQLIGFVGLGLAIASFQQNSHRRILFFQMLSGSVFTLHFIFLGAYSGAALNFVGMLRSIVFYNRDKAWASSKAWLAVFITAFIAAGAITWTRWYSILPILAMVINTFSFWVKNPKYVRLFTLPGSPCWMVYNFLSGSYAGVLTEMFVSGSILVGMFRFDRKKNLNPAPDAQKD